MEISLNDILAWLKTPEAFSNGIKIIDTGNKKKFLQDAFKSILNDKSKHWEKLDVEKLEKIYISIKEVLERIMYLKQHFLLELNYYENDQFEILPPHPWEVHPPEDGKQEIIEAVIKKDKERDLACVEQIKQDKNNIVIRISDSVDILQSWENECQQYLDRLKNKIDTSHFESETDLYTKLFSNTTAKLDPVDPDALYSGLTLLLRGLKILDLIAADTELIDLRRIFGFGGNVEKKIIWKNVAALRHFLIELVQKGKIKEFSARKKHIIASRLFEIHGKPNFDFRKLSSNNGKYARLTELKDLISNL